jgi:hypothetical protein
MVGLKVRKEAIGGSGPEESESRTLLWGGKPPACPKWVDRCLGIGLETPRDGAFTLLNWLSWVTHEFSCTGWKPYLLWL